MRKIAYCGAASLLVFAACASPETNSVPMAKVQPALADAAQEPSFQTEAPVSQSIDIAITGMS
ncbi:MAG: hypothetical protein ACI84O_000546 [Myxococcota bacterium]|jgi:hypothetical protein